LPRLSIAGFCDVPLTKLIENEIALRPGATFGAILGRAPSKGARSPILWRAAFRALAIDADFHALDVPEGKLRDVVAVLKDTPEFIGGAVAVPYKEMVIATLNAVEPDAATIGAVNAIHRGSDGGLIGANTDGAAAVASLETLCGPIGGRTVLQLGLGGAGRAVAVCLARAGAKLRLWNRSGERAERALSELGDVGREMQLCRDPAEDVGRVDVLINCTSAGFAADGRENSEAPIPLALIETMKPSTVVFDIIYQPERTALLAAAARHGLRTLNGRQMNLLQAVIAFTKAFPQADRKRVTEAMSKA
jgi:shikimate dehydrogenase